MKIPQSFILIFLLALSCREMEEKPNTDNKGGNEIKKIHREIDSIKSLKKKKSKRFDTLKPKVATLIQPKA